MIDLNTALEVATAAAMQARAVLLEYREKVQVTRWKIRQDICTTADLAAEQVILEQIHQAYPTHNIMSEEQDEIDRASEYTWLVDPLDGTKHFIRQIPLFSVSIALSYRQLANPVVAVVLDVLTGDLYQAVQGQGAYLRHKSIRVSPQTALGDAFIYTELPTINQDTVVRRQKMRQLEALINTCYRVRSFGLGALGLCLVASGAMEAYVNLSDSTKFVDVAAGILLLQEAGGQLTDFSGQPLTSYTGEMLASNGRLHSRLVEVLSS